jgi:hypothetical protein
MKYVAPDREKKSFTCPHCGVLARQYQYSVSESDLGGGNNYSPNDWLASTICEHCKAPTLWLNKSMLYPNRGNCPHPNPDMPAEIKKDYEEAASIASLSPKAAAALLRLAIQKLCIKLGGDGKNINSDIAFLVKNGLPDKVQKALDIVRVIGNNAVHPGQIDIDDFEIVSNLFHLINVIAETMISIPNKIDTLYTLLPQTAIDAINNRDSSSAE